MNIYMIPEKDIHITNRDGSDYCVFKRGSPIWVWDGRVTSDKTWRRFRRMVFERDGFACRMCGSQERVNLRVHHKKSVKDFPNLYYDIDNTTTLCSDCHRTTFMEQEAKMGTNPYPKTIIDESSGVEVSNNDYLRWEEGRKAGVKEVVGWIKSRSQLEHCDPDVMAYFNEYRWVDEGDWQAKLKEWGL